MNQITIKDITFFLDKSSGGYGLDFSHQDYTRIVVNVTGDIIAEIYNEYLTVNNYPTKIALFQHQNDPTANRSLFIYNKGGILLIQEGGRCREVKNIFIHHRGDEILGVHWVVTKHDLSIDLKTSNISEAKFMSTLIQRVQQLDEDLRQETKNRLKRDLQELKDSIVEYKEALVFVRGEVKKKKDELKQLNNSR